MEQTEQTCGRVTLYYEVSRFDTLKLFTCFNHFSFIILFVCKQIDVAQKLYDGPNLVITKKWGFKKSIGLFLACHICNPACPLLSVC